MIERATPQLVELALAVRTDWDSDDLYRAMASATAAGMPWPRLLTETVRLMTRPEASPRDLTQLAADPTRPRTHDAQAYRTGVAAAREALSRDAS